jgi:hypothetical protein
VDIITDDEQGRVEPWLEVGTPMGAGLSSAFSFRSTHNAVPCPPLMEDTRQYCEWYPPNLVESPRQFEPRRLSISETLHRRISELGEVCVYVVATDVTSASAMLISYLSMMDPLVLQYVGS